jgi:hypothetical protein
MRVLSAFSLGLAQPYHRKYFRCSKKPFMFVHLPVATTSSRVILRCGSVKPDWHGICQTLQGWVSSYTRGDTETAFAQRWLLIQTLLWLSIMTVGVQCFHQ